MAEPISLGAADAASSIPVAMPLYHTTQFGHARQAFPLALSYAIHQPEAMVSLGGASARHVDWSVDTAGTVTNEYLPAERGVKLGVGVEALDRYTYRQDQWNVYEPGAQGRPMFTATFGPPKTNQVIRVGYFDDRDGLIFQRTGSTRQLVLRSSVTGSVLDTVIESEAWDDPGATWDPEKDNLYEIPFEWFGAGNVQFWVNHILLHTIENAGSNVTSYMRRGNLPLTFEIVNTGASATGGYVKAFCAAAYSEGAAAFPQRSRSAENANPITGVNTTGRAILTIRPKATIDVGSLTGLDNRGIYVPFAFGVSGTSGAGVIEAHLDATLGGSPSFGASADPGIEYDVASNTLPTGGEIVARRSLDAATSSFEALLDEFGYPGRCLHNKAFSGLHQLTLVAKANSGTINVSGWIRWKRIG